MERLTEPQKELYEWLVEYIKLNQHSPSIRQMMQGMNLKSPAPVQSRLEHLRNKGYIGWDEGRARTLRILNPVKQGVPILGTIAAGGLIEPFTEAVEIMDLANLSLPPKSYALRVAGDSMIEDLIADGDVVFLRPVAEPNQLKNGTIVAARVEGHGTTLKRFYRHDDLVTLKPANPDYKPIEVPAVQVEVQGSLVGIWRNYN
ncbi:transcriptional repressor LexA [Dolichospermum planctonicum CS-1226]|uniref:LexA repressor n=3 Tax=Dolichospermum TaxID=748770 RepID=A0A480AD06_9CYAN|nr:MULTISPECIES: transcriptional repressor LexA [Nostocales]MBD2143585.1 repressor LexA [Anabaena sp. FACHB-1250]MBD2268468.1 repressor LexA [Anabaena sp. FACHB-1391]MBE9218222.1 repressor LexA [Dolichospermum flos-aquae LEGE 04289]MDB9536810.1 transcriptional repressor LexA [Dolichospermum planctonicum CS-1226]GCL41673.1 LexA family transcriptional repressor [Dolichospermum planctonicum]